MNFLASPEIVTAMAFSGQLTFNPITDSLIGADGKPFKFAPPRGNMLPSDGFTPGGCTSFLMALEVVDSRSGSLGKATNL
jgi:hypothetical protein